MTSLNDRELAELASRAYEAPTADRVTNVREGLLEAAAETPQQKRGSHRASWAMSIAAAILACVAVGLWWQKTASTPASSAPRLASVTTSGRATFERRAEPNGESVHLWDGEIQLDVVELQPMQSFTVITPDARIVVRGTSFTALVQGQILRRVEVVSGRVEIHRDARPVLSLTAGETWARSDEVARAPPSGVEPEPEPEPEPESTAAPSTVREPEPKVTAEPKVTPEPEPEPEQPPVVRPSELAFQKGWRALRAKAFVEAVIAFRAADTEDSPVRVEARYWLAVALMRADDPAAGAAFQRFLEAHPTAKRADEAALLLGRLRLLNNDRDSAKPWLERAARSPRPSVRSRAEQLLAEPGR